MTGFNLQAGGVAVVCCIHDREKRQVTTDTQVAELGRAVGQTYNPRQHKLHLCACCQNLFVDPTDTQVAELGRAVGQTYDRRQHKIHLCACCQNLFVDPTDTPRYCHQCQGPLRHQPGGALPDPTGEV